MLKDYQDKSRAKLITVECKLDDDTVDVVRIPFMGPHDVIEHCKARWGPGWIVVESSGKRQWNRT